MGARQHSTRALAAFDRLLPSQMETAVFIPPMLATRLEDPRRLADARYIAEPKLDGQRVQLHVRGHRTVCAFSRPGRGMIRLPGLAWLREVRWPIASAVLDGEAVAGDGSEGILAVFEARNRPDSPMAFDMNAPYDVDGCIEFARRVEPLDIYWLEEPLHWYLQPADFVRLAAATSIPLAHGERELTRFTVRDFIATGAIRYVQFDSTRAAGFTEGLRVAALAEQHAVMIAPHTAPELHAHLVAALPRCGFGVESHGDAARNPLSHHLLVGGPETRDSFVHLNDKPGFGVEIDWDYAKRYAA
jgi:hypothetical protein